MIPWSTATINLNDLAYLVFILGMSFDLNSILTSETFTSILNCATKSSGVISLDISGYNPSPETISVPIIMVDVIIFSHCGKFKSWILKLILILAFPRDQTIKSYNFTQLPK